MGNEILAARVNKLLSFNGHYVVPSDNKPDRLLDDVACFMGSALALFRNELEVADLPEVKEVAPELAERLWGVYHLLQMAEGAANAANGLPTAKENSNGK
jgi:hypothetical protein